MNIRPEEPADQAAIYSLVQSAFAKAEHSDGTEQDLVEALRKGASYLPQLSLVAEEDSQIIGHILLTKAKIGQDYALVLAPLSVDPAHQGKGVGGQLIEAAHEEAQKLGYPAVLVLGSDLYYPRFGYQEAAKFDIQVPAGFPSPYFMVHFLGEQRPTGKVTFAKEFEI